MEDLNKKEEALKVRLASIERLEREIKERENAVLEKEAAKKQVILRIPSSLWAELAAWAQDDFRSINGQMEFILTEAVKKRKNK